MPEIIANATYILAAFYCRIYAEKVMMVTKGQEVYSLLRVQEKSVQLKLNMDKVRVQGS